MYEDTNYDLYDEEDWLDEENIDYSDLDRVIRSESSLDMLDETPDEYDEETEEISLKEQFPNATVVEISDRFLTNQLAIRVESDRKLLVFKMKGDLYKGRVIHKFRNGVYLFALEYPQTCTKQININEID